MLTRTAAEPRSLARPDNGCISKPTLSTTDSIAVLIISVKMINIIDIINIVCSAMPISNRKDMGKAINRRKISCLKADSF